MSEVSEALGPVTMRPRPNPAWAHACAEVYPSLTHAVPSRAEERWARVAPALTVALWLVFVADTVLRVPRRHLTAVGLVTVVLIVLAATALCFSSVMYQIGRAAALDRLRTHRRTDREELDRHFRFSPDTMTVLVPSYAEEPRVVRATLWSAALQEFPRLRLVLLVDDPPFPTDPATLAKLDETRRLPAEIAQQLEAPRRFCTEALETFRAAPAPGWPPTRSGH
ncbi:hypothetical protein [Raineyella fluvialis]|uniref:Uncharacterized protein n=1 Tax=Raineyella fluvialis TaxID=2662261 RepID=A0A5Q2F9S7_9ACTN|nr:hypothetical protein [Raineyella fluvialis]QGF23652.1 hypothetical protein Rai3103_08190 [Raineyella fluvialis]